MTSALIPFVIGLLLLPVAAEFLVRGAVALASRAGISPLVVGLTVVAFGTSVPELVVCVRAALDGSPAIAFGNMIGSNIANILLILGLTALIRPIRCNPRNFLRDVVVMLASTALFAGLTLYGVIGIPQGMVMLTLLAAYWLYSYRREKEGRDAAAVHVKEVKELDSFKKTNLWLIIVLVVGGLVGVIHGAGLLASGAVAIARGFGVPEEVIGLTAVAVGTSLPELATSIVAALRGHGDVGLGNVVGSNVFNLLGITGAMALAAAPLDVPAQVAGFDVWVMAGVSLSLVPLMLTGASLGRLEALLFLAVYAVYTVIQFVGVETIL